MTRAASPTSSTSSSASPPAARPSTAQSQPRSATSAFGPVVPVIPFSTDDEAIAIANDTEYGLSSGIITANEERALHMARLLETGSCHVNCSSINDEPHVPFGGSKASGLGNHGGRWSVETFSQTRWITLDRGGRPYPPVF